MQVHATTFFLSYLYLLWRTVEPICDLTECGLTKWMTFYAVGAEQSSEKLKLQLRRSRLPWHGRRPNPREKLRLDAETISPSRSSSSYDISSSSTIPSVPVTKESRYGYRYCWGCRSYWKRLLTGLRCLVGFGLVAVICVSVWFIEKDRLI